MIRGKPVDQALSILAFSPKKGARIIRKVLESAIANAEHNDGADIDTLRVKRIFVEKGTVLKRFEARAKGRATASSSRLATSSHGRGLRRAYGQKINPTGFRLSINHNWSSRWYANSHDFSRMLNEDLKVREYLRKKLSHASVGRVVIERPGRMPASRCLAPAPGVVIGKKGEDIELLKRDLQRIMGVPVHVEHRRDPQAELDAQLIAIP